MPIALLEGSGEVSVSWLVTLGVFDEALDFVPVDAVGVVSCGGVGGGVRV